MSHSANQTTPVTLNLFQGPFLRTHSFSRRHTARAASVQAHRRTLRRIEARWTLKQVQGDEIGGGVK